MVFFLVADTDETLSLTQCDWVISARREDFTPHWLSPPFSISAQESAVCQQQPSEGWGRSGRPNCFQWAEPWQKFYSTKIFVMSAPREETGSVFLFKNWLIDFHFPVFPRGGDSAAYRQTVSWLLNDDTVRSVRFVEVEQVWGSLGKKKTETH